MNICELARDHWWSEENGETICQLCKKNYKDLPSPTPPTT